MSTKVIVQQPGVYIEELSGLSLSISSNPTAVPVFLALAADATKFGPSKRVYSWLEFTEALKEGAPPIFTFDINNVLHLSVRTYFENGGGYCYILANDGTLEKEVKKLDDVTLIVAAGQEGIENKLLDLCPTDGMRFAILDGPKSAEDLKNVAGSKYPKHPQAAVYYPWLNASWADKKDDQGKVTERKIIPPSAAIAGAYCKVDGERGVWKAAANVELFGGVTPTDKVSDETQAQYMGEDSKPSINMIRQLLGGGTTIWGARTLNATSDDWRYIPVRRLFNTAERDIKKAMSVAMFEPNSQPTWEKVRSAIDTYLNGIWKQGGLMGNTDKEAYFVQIGQGITMTEADIEQGKMIVKIGMAAVRPDQFIILEFTQDMVQG
ncbi:hypothetical protein BGZ97_001281 [Linnemannia gamsii]|uniref:Tail sheath protein C-terminal domain-containing protein n=1 Tax=Linnemannia gamsii TaxID=64522 RepID=A0A9P6RKZ3_9FUNG|nr:hypothetical protein BGZ97_001281 [Linnemannia gamsii]